MRLLIIPLSLLVLCLTGCALFPFDFTKGGPPPTLAIDSAELTGAVQDLAAELKHGTHHVNLRHAHTYYNGGIQTIQLEFITQTIIQMCEARELIVDLTENFLAKLNQNPVIASEFANFPVNAYNLEIYITFESYFGKFIDPYYIAWICLEGGNVDYYTFDPLDNDKLCWHSRHETYATSREIVVYEREAERKYSEIHHPKIDVFGNARYIPPALSD